MVESAFYTNLDLFRPVKPTKPTDSLTYEKVKLLKVKLGNSAKGWVISGNGAVQSNTATLYFNFGTSGQYPALLEPIFQEGDFICECSEATEPPKRRFTVKSVIEQTFKGQLHHYEVVLV